MRFSETEDSPLRHVSLNVTSLELTKATVKAGVILIPVAIAQEALEKHAKDYIQVKLSDKVVVYKKSDVESQQSACKKTHSDAPAADLAHITEFFHYIIKPKPNESDQKSSQSEQDRKKIVIEEADTKNDIAGFDYISPETALEWQEIEAIQPRPRAVNKFEKDSKVEADPKVGAAFDPQAMLRSLNEVEVKGKDQNAEITLKSVYEKILQACSKAKEQYLKIFNSIPKTFLKAVFGTKEEISTRVAHLFGDLFLKSTGYEGDSQSNMMSHTSEMVSKYIVELEKNAKENADEIDSLKKFLEKLMPGIESQMELEKIGEKAFTAGMIEKLTKLPVGKSIIHGGGWVNGEGGHAMYYEMTKQPDNTFSMKVYNTGAGLEFHPSRVEYNAKESADQSNFTEKRASNIEIRSIPFNRMTSPSFWKTVYEVQTVKSYFHKESQQTIPTRFNGQTIYVYLLNTLNGVVDQNVVTDPKDYIVPQHSGVCSWTGIRAALASHISKKSMERFEYSIKIAGLSELHEANKDLMNLKDDESAQNLLLKCALQLPAEAAQLYRKNSITREELNQANALAATIKIHVDAAKQLRKKELEFKAQQINLSAVKQFSYLTLDKGMTTLNLASTGKHEAATKITIPTAPLNWKFDPNSVTKDLITFYNQFKATISATPLQTLHCINQVLNQLPVPEANGKNDFWSMITEKDKCMEAILDLSRLLHLSAVTANDNHAFYTEVILNMFKTQAIQHKLVFSSKTMQSGQYDDVGISGKPLQLFAAQGSTGDSQIYENTSELAMKEILKYYSGIPDKPFFDPAKYRNGISYAKESPKGTEE